MDLKNILTTGASGLVGLLIVKKFIYKSNLVIGINPALNRVKN